MADDRFEVSREELKAVRGKDNKFYPHQIEGVQWLVKRHNQEEEEDRGAILADDMGLGKTAQVCTLLRFFFKKVNSEPKKVLIVVPKNLIENWKDELATWCPDVPVTVLDEARMVQIFISRFGFKSQIQKANVKKPSKDDKNMGGIALTTYGIIRDRNYDQLFVPVKGGLEKDKNSEALYQVQEDKAMKWDYFILDEGHEIKNSKSHTSRVCRSQIAAHRILMSGTPVQNDFNESAPFISFASGGKIFNDTKQFEKEFKIPIKIMAIEGAYTDQIDAGKIAVEEYKKIVHPYILRRNKEVVLSKYLKEKNDLVFWVPIKEVQVEEYNKRLAGQRPGFVMVRDLIKACGHSGLRSSEGGDEAKEVKKLNQAEKRAREQRKKEEDEKFVAEINKRPLGWFTGNSGKFEAMKNLLNGLVNREKHKVLIFTEFRDEVAMIKRFLDLMGIRWMVFGDRGSEDAVKEINDNKVEPFCLILTKKMGATGLNLVGADRVIIFEPSLNPEIDNQAVDRVYRIGQKKDVVIFRLVSYGTAEEVVYKRQIDKMQMSSLFVDTDADHIEAGQSEDQKAFDRLFKGGNYKGVFALDEKMEAETQKNFEEIRNEAANQVGRPDLRVYLPKGTNDRDEILLSDHGFFKNLDIKGRQRLKALNKQTLTAFEKIQEELQLQQQEEDEKLREKLEMELGAGNDVEWGEEEEREEELAAPRKGTRLLGKGLDWDDASYKQSLSKGKGRVQEYDSDDDDDLPLDQLVDKKSKLLEKKEEEDEEEEEPLNRSKRKRVYVVISSQEEEEEEEEEQEEKWSPTPELFRDDPSDDEEVKATLSTRQSPPPPDEVVPGPSKYPKSLVHFTVVSAHKTTTPPFPFELRYLKIR